jgi:hypothetical protein
LHQSGQALTFVRYISEIQTEIPDNLNNIMDVMFKTAFKIVLLFFLLNPLSQAIAQNSHSGIDSVFGFDPLLYNGKQYTYRAARNANGNPYLFENGFLKGWITVMDKTFQSLDLNYDIVNQVLLLKYVDHAGATIILEVSESWLSSFGIGASEFELDQLDGIKPVIYQVIKKGQVRVQYHWQKELNLENVLSTPIYAFSKAKRTNSLWLNGKEYVYEKNRDFLKGFDPVVKVKVRNYLKNNKIKVNKSSDNAIHALVNYCNTLLNL